MHVKALLLIIYSYTAVYKLHKTFLPNYKQKNNYNRKENNIILSKYNNKQQFFSKKYKNQSIFGVIFGSFVKYHYNTNIILNYNNF